MLEMLGRRAGVMLEAGKAEIGPRGIKQGQRAAFVRVSRAEAVRDLVADVDQLVRGNQRDSSVVLTLPISIPLSSITYG